MSDQTPQGLHPGRLVPIAEMCDRLSRSRVSIYRDVDAGRGT